MPKTEEPEDRMKNAINSYATVDRIEDGIVVLEIENIPTRLRDSLPVESEVPTYMATVSMEEFRTQELEQYVHEGAVFCVIHDHEAEEVFYIMEYDSEQEQRRRDYIASLEADIDGGA